jgi:hypothetical protein
MVMSEQSSSHSNLSANVEKIIKELRNLKRKARLMQYCHGQMAETYSNRACWLSRITILLAGLAVLATTAEAKLLTDPIADETSLQRAAAVFSITVFLLTILRMDNQWATFAGEHQTSLHSFTRFLRNIDITLEGLDGKPLSELEDISTKILNEYSDICEASPSISSRRFLRLKQEHLQIYHISRAVDDNPFVDLRQLRRELRHPGRLDDE